MRCRPQQSKGLAVSTCDAAESPAQRRTQVVCFGVVVISQRFITCLGKWSIVLPSNGDGDLLDTSVNQSDPLTSSIMITHRTENHEDDVVVDDPWQWTLGEEILENGFGRSFGYTKETVRSRPTLLADQMFLNLPCGERNARRRSILLMNFRLGLLIVLGTFPMAGRCYTVPLY